MPVRTQVCEKETAAKHSDLLAGSYRTLLAAAQAEVARRREEQRMKEVTA
jgi:hypothetical protein